MQLAQVMLQGDGKVKTQILWTMSRLKTALLHIYHVYSFFFFNKCHLLMNKDVFESIICRLSTI